MRLISHRGNINGVNPKLENTKEYVDLAIDKGYSVEIDVWYSNGFWLGHDNPQYPVDLEWLVDRSQKLYIHCKNFESLSALLDYNESGIPPHPDLGLVLFFHEKEDYTIISNNKIWAHNLSNINDKCVIPLLTKSQITNWVKQPVYGVCSDFIELLK
tara:strand:+ start:49 stop:519 length:471 start_codon:yes stop_codon:yes gene_type:complete